jgi:hypothetical protein
MRLYAVVNRDIYTPLIFVFIIVVGLFFSFFRLDVLPEKYSYDSDVYQQESARGYIGEWPIGDSKENTNRLYSFLGVTGDMEDYNSSLIFFCYGVVFFIPLFFYKFNFYSFMFVSIWYLLFSMYMIQFTKEHLCLLVTSLMFFSLLRGRWWLLIYFGVCLLYALYFRSYWLIFGVVAFCVYLVLNTFGNVKKSWFFIALGAILGIVILSMIMSGELSSIRFSMNEDRLGTGDANSAIIPLINSKGVVADTINTVWAFGGLIVPLSLLLKAQLTYLVFSTFQFLFIVYLIMICRYRFDNNSIVALSFYFSFLYVQSIFVPDYGAYLRHYMAIIPMILYVFVKNGSFRFN